MHKSGAGLAVSGLDINENLVADLMADKSHISQFPDSEIREMVESGRFEASIDFAAVKSADAILICVPTSLTRHKEPDLSFIEATARSIAPHLVHHPGRSPADYRGVAGRLQSALSTQLTEISGTGRVCRRQALPENAMGNCT